MCVRVCVCVCVCICVCAFGVCVCGIHALIVLHSWFVYVGEMCGVYEVVLLA